MCSDSDPEHEDLNHERQADSAVQDLTEITQQSKYRLS